MRAGVVGRSSANDVRMSARGAKFDLRERSIACSLDHASRLVERVHCLYRGIQARQVVDTTALLANDKSTGGYGDSGCKRDPARCPLHGSRPSRRSDLVKDGFQLRPAAKVAGVRSVDLADQQSNMNVSAIIVAAFAEVRDPSEVVDPW